MMFIVLELNQLLLAVHTQIIMTVDTMRMLESGVLVSEFLFIVMRSSVHSAYQIYQYEFQETINLIPYMCISLSQLVSRSQTLATRDY